MAVLVDAAHLAGATGGLAGIAGAIGGGRCVRVRGRIDRHGDVAAIGPGGQGRVGIVTSVHVLLVGAACVSACNENN